MLSHLSFSKLINLLYQSIEKLSIVRNDDGCAVEGLYCFFKNFFRNEVEVVSWLVEYQLIHWFEQEFNHCQTCSFASTKHLYFLIRRLTAKHKGTKNVVNAQAYVAFCNVVDGFEHR